MILLGAGASFGSGDAYRLQDEHKICTPPLGKNLFKLLETEGGVAASLPSWIKEVFACDFEEGMKEFSQAYPYDLIRFQRELARFLASFCPGQQNTYLKMLKKLVYHDVIYSSLNYDLLLECSASRFRRRISYTTNYDNSCINILKLHGSVNFWPALNAEL
jgi:hypothetical protein